MENIKQQKNRDRCCDVLSKAYNCDAKNLISLKQQLPFPKMFMFLNHLFLPSVLWDGHAYAAVRGQVSRTAVSYAISE